MNYNSLSPRQLKEAVREANYANSQVEREAISAADAAADEVVARHAGLLRAEAVERLDNGASLLRVAGELDDAMVQEVRWELTRGADPVTLSATYERLESGVQKMVAELRQVAAQADLLADRIDSPEDDYERLLERLPALRRGIHW